MATLQTLLIKLGLDVSNLVSGSAQAQRELTNVGAAAGRVTSSATPATAALDNLARAGSSVAQVARAIVPAAQTAASGINSVGATAGMAAGQGMRQLYDSSGKVISVLQAVGGAGQIAAAGTGLIAGAAGGAAGTLSGLIGASAGAIGGVAELGAAFVEAAAGGRELLTVLLGAQGTERQAAAASRDLAEGTDEAGAAFAEASSSGGVLSSTLGGLVGALKETTALMSGLDEAIGELATTSVGGPLGGQLEDLSARARDSLKQLQALKDEVERLGSETIESGTIIDNFDEKVIALGYDTRKFNEQIQELIQSIRELRKEMETPPQGGGGQGPGPTGGQPVRPSPTGPTGPPTVTPADYDAAINEIEKMLGLTAQLKDQLDDTFGARAAATFNNLLARLRDLNGVYDLSTDSLNRMRDSLETLSTQASAGRTMDPRVIEAYTAAVNYLISVQEKGTVTAQDLAKAWSIVDIALNETGPSIDDATRSLLDLNLAVPEDLEQVHALIQGLNESLVDLARRATPEAYSALEQLAQELRMVSASLGGPGGKLTALDVDELNAFVDAIEAIKQSTLLSGGAVGMDSVQKGLDIINRSAEMFHATMRDVEESITVQLPTYDESALAFQAMAKAMEDAGGKSAVIDDMIARIGQLPPATDAASRSLKAMVEAFEMLRTQPGQLTPELAGLITGLQHLELTAAKGSITMDDMTRALVLAAEAEERFRSAGGGNLDQLGRTDLGRTVASAEELADVLRDVGEAGRLSGTQILELEALIERLSDKDITLEGAQQVQADLRAMLDDINAVGDGLEKLSIADIGALALQLDELVASGRMAAETAQNLKDALTNVLKDLVQPPDVTANIAAINKSMVDWVKQEIAAAEELGEHLNEVQMLSAETAQFLDKMLGTLKAGAPEASDALVQLENLTERWMRTGEATEAQLADLFDLLERIGASDALTAGTKKVITNADVNQIIDYLNALKGLADESGVAARGAEILESALALTSATAARALNLMEGFHQILAGFYGDTVPARRALQELYLLMANFAEQLASMPANQLISPAQLDMLKAAEKAIYALETGGSRLSAELGNDAVSLKTVEEALRILADEGNVIEGQFVEIDAAAKQLGSGLESTAEVFRRISAAIREAGSEQAYIIELDERLRQLSGTTDEVDAHLLSMRSTLQELMAGVPLGDQDTAWLMGLVSALELLEKSAYGGFVGIDNMEEALKRTKATGQAVLEFIEKLNAELDAADLATPLSRAVLEAEKLVDALRRLSDEGILTVDQLGELASIENQLSIKDIGLEEVSALNEQLEKLVTSAAKAKEALDSSGKSTATLATGLGATGDAAAQTEMDLSDAKAALGDIELASRLMGKSGTEAAANVKKMTETTANTAAAVSGLQAVSQAAGESEKKLYGAAKAAHEAKVARDALRTAGGAGGAGIPPVPPTTMAGGPGGFDPGDYWRKWAALVAQLNVARGAAAAAAGPLAAAAGAGQAAAGAAAAAGGAAGGAVPPIKNVGAAAGGAAGGFNNMAAGANRAAGSMKNMGFIAAEAANRSSFLNRTLSMAFAFSGGVMVTNVLSFLTNAVAGFNSRIEQARIGFTTMIGEGTEAADVFLKKLLRFAEVTPFEFQGLTEATQSMVAMGFAAEDTLPVLQAVGDAVAAQGKGQEYIDRVTRALGQMLTAGKVRAQDMRQLTEAGIPAWRMLAEAMGITTAELQKMSEQGLVPARTGIEAIVKGMERDFGGMMAKQARTAAGAFSTIHDAALQTVSGAVKPMFDMVSQGMVALADFFVGGGGKYIVPVIQGIGIAIVAVLIPALNGMAASAAAASVAIGGMSIPLLSVIVATSAFALAWQENVGGLRTAVEPIIRGMASALSQFADALGGINAVVPVLTAAIAVLATVITAKLVYSLAVAAGAMALNAMFAINLAWSLAAVTASATGASTAMTLFWAAVGGPITLAVVGFAAALALLVLNFDQVAQGARVAAYAVVGGLKWIADAASAVPIIGEVFKGVAEQLGLIQAEIVVGMATAEKAINDKKAAIAAAAPTATAFDENFWKTWQMKASSAMEEAAADSESLAKKFGYSMDAVRKAAKEAGGAAMVEMAQAIRDHQNEPLDALIQLKEMLANQLTPAAQIARLYGMLMSQEIAAGMASGDPAVVAQTEALVKYLEEQLDELTGGAYTAGKNTTFNFANGMVDQASMAALGSALQRFATPFTNFFDKIAGTDLSGWLSRLAAQMQRPVQISNEWNTKWKPSANAVADAIADINAELQKTPAYTSALSALGSAFSDIRTAAGRYFDEYHRRALESIEDARKQKIAILDAKAALIQGPVDAAQRALDFQRREIEEWRLREAVRNATDPAARRDAILALQDFLAQRHIDEMQAEVDKAKTIYDTQKEAIDRQAELQKEAENRRYEDQKASFERELEQLRMYLEKHPGEWTSANEKVLALLRDYGIDYKTAGALLGQWFVVGLQENIAAAQEAARQLAEAGLITVGVAEGAAAGAAVGVGAGAAPETVAPAPPTGGTPAGGPVRLQAGSWAVLKDNLLALLHRDEMVAPPYIASLLRELGSQSPESLMGAPSFGARPMLMGGLNGNSLNRTIIFQVGDEKLGEITDRALYNQSAIYSGQTTPNTGSLR